MPTFGPATATVLVTALFALTYIGMAAGRIPGLLIDRVGVALLAAIAVVALGLLPPNAALAAIDFPTLAILFGLMVLSAQFGLAGFYDRCAARIAQADATPRRLLALTVAVAGLLSAVLANDIVVFAMTPLLCSGIMRRGLDPRPFLVALAAASNAGSAATIIGNPQNILLGEVGALDFWRFLAICGPVALVSLPVVYLVVVGVWSAALKQAPAAPPAELPPMDRAATVKGIAATAVLIALFALPVPRESAVLLVAAGLLVSRRLSTRRIMGQVDWLLLVLFASLFVVNAAFAATGLAQEAMAGLAAAGLLPDRLAVMAPLALLASNTVGNVPAVVLILTLWQPIPEGAYYGLALLTTLAGNFLLLGSVANIIVAERAAATGARLGFADHARAGVPIALVTMAIAGLWLRLTGWMPW